MFSRLHALHSFLLAPFLPSPCIGTGGGCVDTRAKKGFIAKHALKKVSGGKMFVRAGGGSEVK